MTSSLDASRLELTVAVTSSRIRDISPPARSLHKAVLRAFAVSGHSPDPAALAAATPDGHDYAALLTELHDHDLIRLDAHRRIRAAYPFSAVPTPHTVVIEGGPTVYAMCAIDALGIAGMLGRDTAITSADPCTGAEVRVDIRDGRATWEPESIVVYVGSEQAAASPEGCCPPAAGYPAWRAAAADRCCGVMNFFASTATADEWQSTHPRVTGVVLAGEEALRLGVDIFGRLLHD